MSDGHRQRASLEVKRF